MEVRSTDTRNNTPQLARGNWHNILPALGVPPQLLNRKDHPCPGCGGKDRFRYSNHGDNGYYFCRQCGPGTGFKLLTLVNGWDFKQAYAEVEKVLGVLPTAASSPEFGRAKAANPGACRRLYGASEGIWRTNNPASRYLQNRLAEDEVELMCLLGRLSRVLRYVPDLRYHADHSSHPGMIAIFSDATGKPATLHRTYLTAEGRKAAMHPNRMFMAGTVPGGGAIRLSEPKENLTTMGIAEGIETALSCRKLFGMPVWATTSAGMLKQWQPPIHTNDITIFADNDDSFTGQAAAYALANRLVMEAQHSGISRKITVRIPVEPGTDFNDVLRQQQGGNNAIAAA